MRTIRLLAALALLGSTSGCRLAHLAQAELPEPGVSADWSLVTEEDDGVVRRFVRVAVEVSPEVPASYALAERIAERLAPELPDDIDVIVVALDAEAEGAEDSTYQFKRSGLGS